jgi:glycosyltransferase involved in cell wall biosynthesis
VDSFYFVVPCYNEEEVLRETAKRLTAKIEHLVSEGLASTDSRILFVDDGSKDATWSIIEQLNRDESYVSGLKLSRNRGHQNALLAGLMTAKDYADAIISLDADLQDDVDAIDLFVEQYRLGFDVVYGVRNTRKSDTWFKRCTAQTFYKMMSLMGAEVVYNHADYRLMSKKAVEALFDFQETNLFLRGIVPLIGFRSTNVTYERKARFAGKTKYPLRKMLSLATDGILSFSVKPIKMITSLGFLVFLVSIGMLIYFLYSYSTGKAVAGWTTIVISTWAIGGLQLLAIGVIGEYIGKIYLEAKKRPRYIIDKFLQK